MHPDLRGISEDMKQFALAVLSRAAYDLTFSTNMHPYASAMAIGEAGQGAELAIKARIAEEHPLLLFATLPKSKSASGMLTVDELLEHGRTVQFSELPELLWATTGFRMERVEQFQHFGLLRNACVHFALPPSGNWHSETLRFLFEVVDPIVQHFWKESIANHSLHWDEVMLDGFLEDQLAQAGIEITPSLRASLDNRTPPTRSSP